VSKTDTGTDDLMSKAFHVALWPASYISLGMLLLGSTVVISSAYATTPQATSPTPAAKLQSFCQTPKIQAVAASLTDNAVAVGQIAEPLTFPGGTRFVPAKGAVPAYCQVQGSFVTNPKTRKTANFLATLPANWNGKYLQIGCSGHCGNFAVNNPATPYVTITTQGYPGQVMIKGYATFATDEGHAGFEGGTWAVKGPGKVDEDAITDFYYRADQVLAQVGKKFTVAFYAELTGKPRQIDRAYFNGCSGGGRDAFVAASYFPQDFDGIIGGSAYNLMPRAVHAVATAIASIRSPGAMVSDAQLALVDRIVKAQCDALDGVRDGLIQNPAICKFNAERDLPKCPEGKRNDTCFTKAQVETLSTVLSATTDEHGNVVQPGYSVSELQAAFAPPHPPKDPAAIEPWPDTASQEGGLWALGNADLKIFAHANDPEFSSRALISYKSGGPGQVTDFHSVVPRAEFAKDLAAGAPGIGHFPEKADKLIELDRKFLIWHDFSDEKLSPYVSINYYKQLAARHGGYASLQKNVRLFMIPDAGHCSMSGVGPGNFDPLTAMEDWVEKGKAPDALLAKLYNPLSPLIDPSKTPLRTMPLCKFPEMAHYSGKGDLKEAANWTCPTNDTSLLKVGESGRLAGIIQ
jgi:feruloyl esterase